MKKLCKVLLIEDNEGDIILTLKAMEKNQLSESIHVVKDGEKAISYLKKNNGFKDAETPDLILLDINLPKINGLEVLQIIKNDEDLKPIPVIMLTTSESAKDIELSYKNHANCYITKPVNFKNYLSVIETIKKFWIQTASLPVNHFKNED